MPDMTGPEGQTKERTMLDPGLRSRGMRDLGPEAMRRFRAAERVFLDVVGAREYQEIRTPTIEPLHLFTATSSLSPQLLDRVYSFLDWDGWSGERVVLRPDGTVPAARWFEQRWQTQEPARLCYVQQVYRFEPGDGEREQWQCGVELFGLPALQADAELLLLARELLTAIGGRELQFDLAHAGLVRAVLEAAGVASAEQAAMHERLLSADPDVVTELAARFPAGAAALRMLLAVDGAGLGYLQNLRAALLPVAPATAVALDELEAAARALDAAGCAYRLVPATAANFEYYTGLAFSLRAGGVACIGGGRYDGLGEAIGGRAVPGSGFGADLLRLAAILAGDEPR